MKKIATILATGMLLFSSAFSTTQAGETIKIGLCAPITGNYAEFGENFKYSADMAAARINAAGGVLGKQIEVVIMDSKGDPKEAALIAQKFVENPEIVAQVGDFTSTCCMAAAPIYERGGLVQLSPTASHPDFAPSGKYMFSIVGSQKAESPFNAEYMAKDYLGLKKIGVVYINNDYGKITMETFVEAAKKAGLEITAVELFMEAERDFGAILTKIRQTNPDGLHIVCHYNEAAAICRQIRKMNWKVKKFSPSAIFSANMITLGGAAAEGICSSTYFALEDPDPKVQSYIAAFEKVANRKPNLHAANAYDCFLMLAQSIEKAGSTDRAAIRDSLAATKDFEGVTGNITFSPDGDVDRKFKIMMIEDGNWVVKKDYTK